jgi:hypothetical protein
LIYKPFPSFRIQHPASPSSDEITSNLALTYETSTQHNVWR